MFQNLDVFQYANAMARHAGQRQAIVAQNIANADTPGYSARDVVPFETLVKGAEGGGTLRATRGNHLHGSQGVAKGEIIGAHLHTSDPNENSVSLETEMLKSIEVQRQHQRALTIYKSSMNVLRAVIGR